MRSAKHFENLLHPDSFMGAMPLFGHLTFPLFAGPSGLELLAHEDSRPLFVLSLLTYVHAAIACVQDN